MHVLFVELHMQMPYLITCMHTFYCGTACIKTLVHTINAQVFVVTMLCGLNFYGD